MKHLVLRARAYGSYKNRLAQIVKSDILEIISDLDASVTDLRIGKNGHIIVDIEGEDEEFVANVLTREFGAVPKSTQIINGSTYEGQFVDVGRVGYGLYVDIGMAGPRPMDALLPLYTLREQFSMTEYSLRALAKALVFVDNLPVSVTLNEVNLTKQKIEATLSKSTLDRLRKWVQDDHERLLVLGCTEDMIDRALKQTQHEEDIYKKEQLGYFEFSLRCKRSTRASGILAAIGPKLKGVSMHLFIPREVGAHYNATT